MSPLAGVRDFLSSHTQTSSTRTAAYPPVPPSLDANDYELRDYDVSGSREQRPAHSAPKYTPYLGLQARLSQSWINKWTILLLLVLCRVLLAVRSLDSNISSAKSEALSACTSVENVGSAMASMPYYLSAGVNTMAADGVTTAVNALMSTLIMTLTGVEEIVLFVINMLTSTYVCLITLLVSGSIAAALDMIEEVSDFMNKTIATITSDISGTVASFETDLNSLLADIGSITSIFGAAKTVPTINVNASIASLNSIQIPASFDAKLDDLKSNLPNFTQVQAFTNSVIRLPFEEVKKLVNESLGGTYKFNKSMFPVAQKQALTFCSDNNTINSFFDGLADVAISAKKIFIAVMIVAAVLACIPMAYHEIWRYRTMLQRSQLLQKNAFDPMDVMYIASRPYTSTAGIKLASRFQSSKRQILVRWAVAYATSMPALFVLALGIAGLFSALCQYLLLKTIEKEVPALAAEVGNFTEAVVGALTNASEAWAVSANAVINSTNTKVNQDVFGWVNITTTAINSTLNTFVDESNSMLNTTFGGTILYTPIKETLSCLVGLKITALQKGLTWVSDNAHVTFPQFNKDVFSLGAAASLTNSTADDSFLSSPASNTSDDVTGAITKLTTLMASGIYEEFYIAACLVGLWFIIALIGVVAASINFFGRDKTRAEGGPQYNLDSTRRSSTPPPPFSHRPAPPPPPHAGHRFPDFGGGGGGCRQSAVVSKAASVRSDDYWGKSDGFAHEEHKMDVVGQGSVELERGHVRASSHGYIDEKRGLS